MFEKVYEFVAVTLKNKRIKTLDYDTWIFSSNFNNTFDYNSKYLFEYVVNHITDIKPLFIINDDELRKNLSYKYGNDKFITTKSKEDYDMIVNSGVWLFSAGLPLYGANLNEKRLVINLWHGVPLKKIGLLENNIGFFRKKYFKYVFSKNYTHILTTSNNLKEVMAKSFGVDMQKIVPWGQPRNDVLFETKSQESLRQLYSNLPAFSRVILYAPTFRDDSNTKLFPFDNFDFNDFLNYLEENDLILFLRTHQFERSNAEKYLSDRIRLINNDIVEDIMDLLNVFDLLITDYSSIYIDFLLTAKPIMFLPYDKADYFKTRGFNFEYNDVTPGPKPNTYNNFKTEILSLLNNKEYFLDERAIINSYFNDVKEPCSQNIVKNIKNEIDAMRKEKYDK